MAPHEGPFGRDRKQAPPFLAPHEGPFERDRKQAPLFLAPLEGKTGPPVFWAPQGKKGSPFCWPPQGQRGSPFFWPPQGQKGHPLFLGACFQDPVLEPLRGPSIIGSHRAVISDPPSESYPGPLRRLHPFLLGRCRRRCRRQFGCWYPMGGRSRTETDATSITNTLPPIKAGGDLPRRPDQTLVPKPFRARLIVV